jgi:PhzF family phenazine biosynthesis protein
MPESRTIWLVDAFTDKPYAGNPAGVMVVGEFPSHMREIAAEMNCSETTFVKHLGGSHYHIRWLTPTVEVKLCGHATLSAAHILFNELHMPGNELVFDSLSGPLRVTKDGNALVLDFPLQKVSSQLNVADFATAFNLDPSEIVEAVQAMDDAMVVVHDEKVVRACKPDFAKLGQLDYRVVMVTAKGKDYDFVSRVFGPKVGVNEDPVTGSAHCKLADYWSQKLGKTHLSAFQASARGGELDISIHGDRVHLKGHAVTIMKGTWRVE